MRKFQRTIEKNIDDQDLYSLVLYESESRAVSCLFSIVWVDRLSYPRVSIHSSGFHWPATNSNQNGVIDSPGDVGVFSPRHIRAKAPPGECVGLSGRHVQDRGELSSTEPQFGGVSYTKTCVCSRVHPTSRTNFEFTVLRL